jgi:hypothetical protein
MPAKSRITARFSVSDGTSGRNTIAQAFFGDPPNVLGTLFLPNRPEMVSALTLNSQSTKAFAKLTHAVCRHKELTPLPSTAYTYNSPF